MLDFLRRRYINTVILATTLASFTIAPLTTISALPTVQEVIFYNDLAKAVKKLTKSRQPKKSVSALFHLKKLIENGYGVKINVEGCLMEAQKHAKNNGLELSNDEMQGMAKLLKIKKLKWLNKAEFMSDEITKDDLEFLLNDLLDKASDTYHNMSGNIVMGVSCILGAFFLRYVPIPGAKVLSDALMITGLTYLGNELVERHDKECEEHKAAEQNKNKQKYYPPAQDDIIFVYVPND